MEYSELEMLEDLFDSVKPIEIDGVEYKALFDYGTVEDLNAFLRVKRRTSTYPLIWLSTPFKAESLSRVGSKSNLVFTIATNGTSVMANRVRAQTTIKKVLLPLIANIKEAIKRCSFISRDGEDIDLTYHFNFSVEDDKSSDIWDAIEFGVEFKFKMCNYKKVKL